MPKVIKTCKCGNCQGKGHKLKEGIKHLCKHCDGSGRICICCGNALFKCLFNPDGAYSDDDDEEFV